MRHVRHETLLQSRQTLQLNNLLLQGISHAVKGNTQTRRLVLTLNRHTLIQIAGSQTFRRDSGLRNRAHHKSGHKPHYRQHHSQQGTETTEKHKVDVRNRCRRIGHVIHSEQTVIRVLCDRNMRTHDEHGVGALTIILNRRHRRSLPIHTVLIANSVLKIRGNTRRVKELIATLLRNKTLLTLPL